MRSGSCTCGRGCYPPTSSSSYLSYYRSQEVRGGEVGDGGASRFEFSLLNVKRLFVNKPRALGTRSACREHRSVIPPPPPPSERIYSPRNTAPTLDFPGVKLFWMIRIEGVVSKRSRSYNSFWSYFQIDLNLPIGCVFIKLVFYCTQYLIVFIFKLNTAVSNTWKINYLPHNLNSLLVILII